MARTVDNIKIKLLIEPSINFWDAIKLRIAGKNYRELTEEIIKRSMVNLKNETADSK